MAKVNLTDDGAITIKISDPVELERLLTVLHRTNSTKVIAIREAIMDLLVPTAPVPTDSDVEAAIIELEKIANAG